MGAPSMQLFHNQLQHLLNTLVSILGFLPNPLPHFTMSRLSCNTFGDHILSFLFRPMLYQEFQIPTPGISPVSVAENSLLKPIHRFVELSLAPKYSCHGHKEYGVVVDCLDGLKGLLLSLRSGLQVPDIL